MREPLLAKEGLGRLIGEVSPFGERTSEAIRIEE